MKRIASTLLFVSLLASSATAQQGVVVGPISPCPAFGIVLGTCLQGGTPLSSTSFTGPLFIGGSGTTGTQLTSQTTTGNGTTDGFLWTRGNNGATTAMTLNNTGLGVGSVAPDTLVTINANTVASPGAGLGGANLHLVGGNAISSLMILDSFAGLAGVNLRRADTTAAGPTAVAINEIIGFIGGLAYTGAAYASVGGSIRYVAAEAQTPTALGQFISVFTIPTTTATPVESARFNASGGLSIGTTTDPGVGSLQLNAQAFIPNALSDSGLADSTACIRTSNGQVLKGSGTLGICLGTSGRQFKTDFVPMLAGLDEIMRLPLWNYRYLAGYGDSGARMQYGLTAQDVDDVIPDLVRHDMTGAAINFDIGAFLPISMRAIQQLERRVTRLENSR